LAPAEEVYSSVGAAFRVEVRTQGEVATKQEGPDSEEKVIARTTEAGGDP
jgi:hypothetical protein